MARSARAWRMISQPPLRPTIASTAATAMSGQAVPVPGQGPGRVHITGPGGVSLGLGEVDGQGRLQPRRLFRWAAQG